MKFPRAKDPYCSAFFAADGRHQFDCTGIVRIRRIRGPVIPRDTGLVPMRHGDGICDIVVRCNAVTKIVSDAVSACCCAVQPPAEETVSEASKYTADGETDSPTLNPQCPSLYVSARLRFSSTRQAGVSGNRLKR